MLFYAIFFILMIFFLGVFGGLDLNGKHVTHSWVKLAADANVGDQTITVNKEVGWVVENEIVVTPTGYSAWETETFTITNVNAVGGQTVLTLNDTLRFKHLGKSTGARCVRKKKKKILYNTTRGRTHLLPFF
jgi:hypothetical protein